MRLRTIGLITAIAIGVFTNSVSAQDEPRVGIAMGYPASLGVVWQVTDGIALRPEIGASKSSGEFTGTSTVSFGGTTITSTTLNSNDNWQITAGVSALFYLSKHDALRTYVSPRWAYTRTTSNSSSNTASSTSSSTGNSQFVSGSFGAQYALGRRFSVFGEVGAGYSHVVTSPTIGGTLVTSSVNNTFSTRSGAGVILYF